MPVCLISHVCLLWLDLPAGLYNARGMRSLRSSICSQGKEGPCFVKAWSAPSSERRITFVHLLNDSIGRQYSGPSGDT